MILVRSWSWSKSTPALDYMKSGFSLLGYQIFIMDGCVESHDSNHHLSVSSRFQTIPDM